MTEYDYELIEAAQQGNEESVNYLYKKFRPIIVRKSKLAIVKVGHHGIEINDIMQEAFIGLQEAIDNYNDNNDSTFYTFANLCIDRKIVNFLKKATSYKSKLLNDAIYIDETIENVIKDNNISSMDIDLQEESILDKLEEELTDFEKQVFDLKVKGYDTKEISDILNKEQKSVYNAVQRIKEKIQKIAK